MSQYRSVDRGGGSRPGQLLQHASDPQRWLVRVFIGRNAKGKKQYASEVVRGGRREADAALIKLLHAKGAGRLAPRSTIRLSELIEEWGRHKAREVAPRTLRQYMDSLERYVLPSLGHRKVSDLQLREIDALYGHMLIGDLPAPEGPHGTTGRPLSAGTVRLTHAALTQALSQAVRWGLVPSNPAARWGLVPSNPAAEASVPVHRPREKNVLTAAERATWLVACRGSFYYAFYALLVDTGLRPGEAWTLPMRDFRRTLREAGIAKAMTFYSLRHTFATLHGANGTSLKTVSALLGHATIQQTADTYMHDDTSVTVDWMRKYEQMVSAADQESRPHALN